MVVNLDVSSVTQCANGYMATLSLRVADYPELGDQRFMLTLSNTAIYCSEDTPDWLDALLEFQIDHVPDLVMSCYRVTSTGPRKLTSVHEIWEMKQQWESVLSDTTQMLSRVLGTAVSY